MNCDYSGRRLLGIQERLNSASKRGRGVLLSPEDVIILRKFIDQEEQLRAELREAQGENEWLYHNGGLMNNFAKDWLPGNESGIAYVKRRCREAMQEK